jgi:outer membrane PBP1 activator LpoA protein
MEQEQPSPYGKQSTTSETQADKEWTAFERDLDQLGRQLAALQVHTAALGSHLVESLEARFREVKTQAESFRKAKEVELEQVRQNAWRQAESAFSEARTKSAEAARQMWERAEPLRQGAKDVGEGLARAWGELRTSFGKAAGRLHTESKDSPANGPAHASIEQRRDS